MRESTMPTYTVMVTGPGALAPGFEQLLDVLPAAAMEGSEETPTATLWFDVRARNADEARERAWLRAQSALRLDDATTIAIVRSSTVEGRRPWWRRLLSA